MWLIESLRIHAMSPSRLYLMYGIEGVTIY